jgi:hypothetical protein
MNYKRNEDTLKELKTESTLNKFSKYKNSWIQHVDTIHRNTIPTPLENYEPRGLRNRRTPLKRLTDG